MKNTILMLVAGALALFSTQTRSLAVPMLEGSFTTGGHSYSLYAENGISFTAASAFAQGVGGYLAVLTTQAETTAVYNGLIGKGFFTSTGYSQDTEAWLGGVTADTSISTVNRYNWKWINNEAWSNFDALNFAPSEPNGDSTGLAINRYGQSTFNDEGGHVGGFIVERAVPDSGTTVSLLGLAMSGVALVRRKVAA